MLRAIANRKPIVWSALRLLCCLNDTTKQAFKICVVGWALYGLIGNLAACRVHIQTNRFKAKKKRTAIKVT